MTRAMERNRRVFTAEATWRRRIPTFLLPAVVRLRVFLGQRNPLVWETARLNMRFLLEKTRPDADIDAAAREYLRQAYWRAERRWRPRLISALPVEGADRLLAERDPERGLVLVFLHHANFDGMWPSLARVGVHCHAVGAAFLFADDAPAFLKQHLRLIQSGATTISAAEGTAGITAALERKAIVAIAPDVAGRTQVEFAGRSVVGSFGAARLAYDTDSQVVLCTSHKDRTAPARLRLSPLLDPRDFPDARALLTEILRRHEAVVMEWPEAYDRPMQRWGATTEEDRAIFGDTDAMRPL